MNNKDYNLEGPLQENRDEKGSKDKITEDIKLLFNDVKNTKVDIDKNVVISKLNLVLRIFLGLTSLAICVLCIVNSFRGGFGDPLLYILLIGISFASSMILLFCKKEYAYTITTAIFIAFLIIAIIGRFLYWW